MTAKTKTGYPRVTTILNLLDKPALKQWAVNCATEFVHQRFMESEKVDKAALAAALTDAKREWRNVGDKAKDIGSTVHELIEALIKGGAEPPVVDTRPEVIAAWRAFQGWNQGHVQAWLGSEIEVVHTIAGEEYEGRLDAPALMKDGRKLLVDFKVAKGIYNEYWLQLAAYYYAYRENPLADHKLDGAGILRLDKETGLPEWVEVSLADLERYFAAFIALVRYYHAQHGLFAAPKRAK